MDNESAKMNSSQEEEEEPSLSSNAEVATMTTDGGSAVAAGEAPSTTANTAASPTTSAAAAAAATTSETVSQPRQELQQQQQKKNQPDDKDDDDEEEEEETEKPLPPLKRGDLVRISQVGRQTKKSLKDRDDDALGRVTAVITQQQSDDSTTTKYTVHWIVGGTSNNLQREWLLATTAEKEGFLVSNDNGASSGRTRTKRQATTSTTPSTATKTVATTSKKKATSKPKASKPSSPSAAAAKSKAKAKPAASKRKSTDSSNAAAASRKTISTATTAKGKKRKLVETTKGVAPPAAAAAADVETSTSSGMNLYEKHRREFDRIVTRLEKLEKFGWFWDEAPDEFDEKYSDTAIGSSSSSSAKEGGDSKDKKLEAATQEDEATAAALPPTDEEMTNKPSEEDAAAVVVFPSHAPYNWEMIRRREAQGRYILHREKVEEEERQKLLKPYFEWKQQQKDSGKPQQGQKTSSMKQKKSESTSTTESPSKHKNKASLQELSSSTTAAAATNDKTCNPRVFHSLGVHWDMFKSDVLGMIDAALERDADNQPDEGGRGSLSVAAHKVRDAVVLACERTGERQKREMRLADDQHFFQAVLEESSNTEAAMQSWRQSAFPERIYEQLSNDVVSAGLEELDERIASYELKTNLPDSFVGLSYRYDDTGQSEAWMQSVVEETEANSSTSHKNKKKRLSKDNDKTTAQAKAKKEERERRQAALALAAASDGVRRAQVAATMNSLLIGVQDRVMTEWGVLRQPELRSANWLSETSSRERADDKSNDNEGASDDAKLAINDSKPLSSNESKESVVNAKNDGVVGSNTAVGGGTSQEKIKPDLMATESSDSIAQPTGIEAKINGQGDDEKGKTKSTSSADAIAESGVTKVVATHDVESNEMSERAENVVSTKSEPTVVATNKSESAKVSGRSEEASVTPEVSPEIVEQPVWGMDCYTRRNISLCLESEFDPETALTFVEKWLLPAINACPVELAHDISNAVRILEDLPLQSPDAKNPDSSAVESHTLLGNAIVEKIRTSAPPWLNAAAHLLRRAWRALGPDFFRVHPKGHGSIVLSQAVKPHTLVTFYRGEIYPSWRWGEKMDAIGITQERKGLKPALPDFYNMALERPQSDPRGYGLLFVDASRKAGHGSSLSHSCEPTCEVRVAAVDGKLCLAMTTLRELEMGEELTFNYNAATDSLIEYRSAVCLCGYGKCRGSFLHFATADCYQQVLNRNAPIATRFSNLIKGTTKKVMSEEDSRVLENHGFKTASFGAISVNRRKGSNQGTALSDSLDNIPVWLRTYVADTLRYIEYERRALPIALICGELANKDKEAEESPEVGPTTKEPTKPENGFLFFQRTQSDFLNALLERQGTPGKGMHLAIARKKAAAVHWQAMSDEEKEEWKAKALADFEKRKKAWKAGQAKAKKETKAGTKAVEKGKKSKKPGIKDILENSAFETADAEGINAMEHRIQQLTQSLSRVGRVLDRHREGCLMSQPEKEQEIDENPEVLRELAHAPLDVMSDEKVIDWIWNREEGVVSKLMLSIKNARCSRPSLEESLANVKTQYKQLDAFSGSSENAEPLDPVGGRLVLKQGLVELRSVLLNELSAMAKEFRRYRSQLAQERRGAEEKTISDEVSSSNQSSMGQSNKNGEPAEGETASQATESEGEGIEALEASSEEAVGSAVQVILPTEENGAEPALGKSQAPSDENADKKSDSITGSQKMLMDNPWISNYAERFTLQAAADVLLMYSRTSNFFVTKPYAALKSTPIEVYARELGNAVPRSVIDDDVADKASTPSPASPQPKARKPAAKTVELCSPDDVVAEVAVKYQPEYVVSQLLQWYNGGMGQAPGLPNLFGCVLLPFIDGCWSSELLGKNKLKAEKRTLYETKVRPQLIEWLQDPYQRGDPWPDEVQQAFAGPDTQQLSGDKLLLDLPFGSPILDFLVTGDESNIHYVLEQLDEKSGEKSAKKGDGTLLTSVDRGRPAQAVCRWVQCENPDCLKWRKIPWHVDIDLLPEHFFCKDNKWSQSGATCDSPEDDWDGDDKLVGDDGKVEGTPILKDGYASPSKQSHFTVGSRFDVLRKTRGQSKFTVATVTHIDFSGETKRVKFHFQKTSAEQDEWIQFGSKRIAALHSKTCPPQKRKNTEKQDQPGKLQKKQDGAKPNATGKDSKGNGTAVEATDFKFEEKDFENGKRFDVLRHSSSRKKFMVGIVIAVDFSGDERRIKFHYPKTSTCNDEWVSLESKRIAPLHSKTSRPQKRKNATKESESVHKETTDSAAGASADVDDSSKAVHDDGASEAVAVVSCEEKHFEIGSRFDVLRKVGGRDKYLVATVSDIEFAGTEKRIKFHFRKTSANQDEWLNANSSRIAPLHSRTIPPQKKKKTAPQPAQSELTDLAPGSGEKEKPKAATPAFWTHGVQNEESVPLVGTNLEANEEGVAAQALVMHGNQFVETTKVPSVDPRPPDSSVNEDLLDFEVGRRFDVLRGGRDKFCVAKVSAIDFSNNVRRVKFHFKKTTDDKDEWINVGTNRIAPLHSITKPQQRKRIEPTQIGSTLAPQANELISTSGQVYSSLGVGEANDSLQNLSHTFRGKEDEGARVPDRDGQEAVRQPAPENPTPSMDATQAASRLKSPQRALSGIELLAFAAEEEEASPFRMRPSSTPANSYSPARRAMEASKLLQTLETNGLSPRPQVPPATTQSCTSGTTATGSYWTNTASSNPSSLSQFGRSSLDNYLTQRSSHNPTSAMHETREQPSHFPVQSAGFGQMSHAPSGSGSGLGSMQSQLPFFNGMQGAQRDNGIGNYQTYPPQQAPSPAGNPNQMRQFAPSLPQTNASHSASGHNATSPYNHFGSGIPLALTPLLRRGGQGSHPSFLPNMQQQHGQGQGHR